MDNQMTDIANYESTKSTKWPLAALIVSFILVLVAVL